MEIGRVVSRIKEADRLGVVRAVIGKRLKRREAAAQLGLMDR